MTEENRAELERQLNVTAQGRGWDLVLAVVLDPSEKEGFRIGVTGPEAEIRRVGRLTQL